MQQTALRSLFVILSRTTWNLVHAALAALMPFFFLLNSTLYYQVSVIFHAMALWQLQRLRHRPLRLRLNLNDRYAVATTTRGGARARKRQIESGRVGIETSTRLAPVRRARRSLARDPLSYRGNRLPVLQSSAHSRFALLPLSQHSKCLAGGSGAAHDNSQGSTCGDSRGPILVANVLLATASVWLSHPRCQVSCSVVGGNSTL